MCAHGANKAHRCHISYSIMACKNIIVRAISTCDRGALVAPLMQFIYK